MPAADNLSDAHIFAFGHIILQWGRFEMAMSQALWRLLRIKGFNGLVLTTNLSYVQKRDTLRALLGSPMTPLSVKRREILKRILDHGENHNTLRGFVAHGLWMKGKRRDSITQLGLKARGRLKLHSAEENQRDYTPEDLMDAARAIYYLTEELLALNNAIARKSRTANSVAAASLTAEPPK